MRRGEFVSVYFSLLSCSVSEEDSSVRLLGLRDRTVSGERDISHSVYLEVGLSPLSPQQGYFSRCLFYTFANAVRIICNFPQLVRILLDYY